VCDQFDKDGHALEESIDLKVHGRLCLFSSVVVTIVFAFGIDSREENFEKKRCISE
jgi:hypothetical protein